MTIWPSPVASPRSSPCGSPDAGHPSMPSSTRACGRRVKIKKAWQGVDAAPHPRGPPSPLGAGVPDLRTPSAGLAGTPGTTPPQPQKVVEDALVEEGCWPGTPSGLWSGFTHTFMVDKAKPGISGSRWRNADAASKPDLIERAARRMLGGDEARATLALRTICRGRAFAQAGRRPDGCGRQRPRGTPSPSPSPSWRTIG